MILLSNSTLLCDFVYSDHPNDEQNVLCPSEDEDEGLIFTNDDYKRMADFYALGKNL